jgi:DNA-binding NarL/FixJ family response regulator
MIRLLIADDHPVVRDGIKHIVEQHAAIKVVGEAADGDTVLSLLKSLPIDVLLLDVSMPGPGALDLIREAKKLKPKTSILVLSIYSEQMCARRVFSAGADGYLTKTHSSAELANAITHVHSGRKYVTSSLAEDLAVDLSVGGKQPHELLSNREYQVFLQLGIGKSVGEISTALKISAKTIRTYRSRILQKTELRSTAELIYYALSRGLVAKQ